MKNFMKSKTLLAALVCAMLLAGSTAFAKPASDYDRPLECMWCP